MAIQPNEHLGTSGVFPSNTGSTNIGARTSGMTDSTNTGRSDSADSGVAAQAQDKAAELMTRAGEKARSRFDDGKQRAARELGSVAHALRQCGADQGTDEPALLAPYVSRVADQVDRLSTFIDTHSAEELARDVETFARRNPAVFLGGCFALGMVAARFLKASRPELPVPYGYQQNVITQAGYSEPRATPGYGSPGFATMGSTGMFDAGADRARSL